MPGEKAQQRRFRAPKIGGQTFAVMFESGGAVRAKTGQARAQALNQRGKGASQGREALTGQRA